MLEASSCRIGPPGRRALAGLLWSVAAALLQPGPGAAQTDAEVNSGIQFDFSAPGARSLAMGGAFVGLADDATAAFTNPAGLLDLTEPEVSLEVRRFAFDNTFTDRGHALGFVSGRGIDTIEGLRTAEAETQTTGVSFLSYVHPWAASDGVTRWALALYRHELVNFEARFRTEGAFFDFFDANGVRRTQRHRPIVAALDLEIVNFGLSAAYRLSDELRLGLGISFYDFEIDSLQSRFSTIGFDPVAGEFLPPEAPGSLYGPADFSSVNEIDFQQQLGTGEDTGINVGLLWHVLPRRRDGDAGGQTGAGSKLWLGVVYRQAPEFEFDAVSRIGAFREALSGDPRGTPTVEQEARFHVPDVLALGLSFFPTEAIRITFDYNRIEYSALTAETISIHATEEDLDAEGRTALEGLAVDDVDAFRLGFEYLFTNLGCPGSKAENCSVGLRLGAWHDPAHKMRFAGEPGIDVDTRAVATRFLGADDEIHFSAGLGFVFEERFRLDAAADISDAVETFSLSAVFRFG